MKCKHCNVPPVKAHDGRNEFWVCLQHGLIASEADLCQLKRRTPTEVPEPPESPGEANVERLRPILACGPRQGRGSKYGNKVTERSGIKFASKHEAEVYGELCMMEAAGEISCLATQRKYLLAVNDQKICVYIADFVYIQDHKQVVVDAKGFKTPAYKLKKKMMKIILGIDIVEM